MKNSFTKLSSLTVIIGIYLYFTSWIYVSSYYQHFGVSVSSLKIDYYSYLVYSVNVIFSSLFLVPAGIGLGLVVLVWACFKIFKNKKKGVSTVLKTEKATDHGRNRTSTDKISFGLLLLFLIGLFPWLFYVAQEVAWTNYTLDRSGSANLRYIQFLFRNDSGILNAKIDSINQAGKGFVSNIEQLKNDSTGALRLIGESDDFYIVLDQPPADNSVSGGSVPNGRIYFVNKKDVALSKINLSAF